MALAERLLPNAPRDEIERRGTYVALMGVFLSLFATFSTRALRGPSAVRPFDFVLLALSTFRIGRMLAYDQVAQPVREPFTQTEPDASGAGDTVVPDGRGARRALGELFSCPICTGTWVAAILTYGLHLLPGPTRVLITMMGAVGAAELLGAGTEAMSWSGAEARVRVGKST